jgi:ATP-dependent protease HslVU (ClpYQ) peptidase subunit
MTTIAWDGKFIASDGQKSSGNYICPGSATKIIRRENMVFALTGISSLFEPMIDWYLKGAAPKECPRPLSENSSSFSILIIFKEGKAFKVSSNIPYPEEVFAPDAWGSGGVWAVGALKAGADVRRAVEIAIECDTSSGGEIQVMDLSFQMNSES